MNRIAVLQPHIANQIAAGEVVERPASVVKELVENAVDAGATAITVEIENGGVDYIRVTDNGGGIPADDALLAFERHATSKIHEQEDLSHIDTLGFRGEALSSIAAVAQVELTSRERGAETGMRVRMEGGACKLHESSGCPEGTTVQVENLFFNVPARRKFLRSSRTEGGNIGEYVSRMILARPDIAFRFQSGGKDVYRSAGDGILKNALYCIYGSEVLPHLREVSFDDGYLRLTGYVGTPEIARPNRTQQTFLLNGRYIRSLSLSAALQRAYDTRLMGGRFPFAVLNLLISSREVDINVHPSKLEARFAQESRITGAVERSSRLALGMTYPPAVNLREAQGSAKAVFPAEAVFSANGALGRTFVGRSAEVSASQYEKPPFSEPLRPIPPSKPADPADFAPVKMEGQSASIRLKEAVYEIPNFLVASPRIEQPREEARPEQTQLGGAPMKIIGTAFDTFWMVQQGEDLFFIDQHAAHERRLYERFMAQEGERASQTLLVSELLRLAPIEFDALMRQQDLLAELGFELEPFGATSIRVSAVPSILAGAPVAAVLRDAVELLEAQGKATPRELRREAVIQASCKHAVKAGDPLTHEEISELLRAFTQGGLPMTCPHGRPVMIRLSRKEIEKLFKRIV